MNRESHAPAAISSEERLALENILLDGISDSSTTLTIVAKRSKVFRQKPCGRRPAPPVHRDGLGNYVPPPGGKPLSSLLEPSTGPAYDDQHAYVKKTYPKYTMGGQNARRGPKITTKGLPAPNRYNVRGSLKWGRCKSVSIRSKVVLKDKSETPGPAYVLPKVPTNAPLYSMAVKPKKQSGVFFNNPHVTHLDPSNPGPCLVPSDDHWLDKPRTLGVRHVDYATKVSGPGPGHYIVKRKTQGPSYSLGAPKTEPGSTEGPGPGRYKLRTTIGKGPKAPLVGKPRHIASIMSDIPGPDIYHRAGFRLDEPGFTLKSRWMDSDGPKVPGPSDYNVTLPPPKGPAFTIKQKAKDISKDSPGPADYTPTVSNWDKPGKSFGLYRKGLTNKEKADCPNFLDRDTANMMIPSGPAYSFRKSTSEKKEKKCPGPSDYVPKPAGSKKTITMGKSLPAKEICRDGPGPAQAPCVPESKIIYDPSCPKLLGTRAASLKSRHTPLKYTGLRDSSLLPPTPKEIACAPLIS